MESVKIVWPVLAYTFIAICWFYPVFLLRRKRGGVKIYLINLLLGLAFAISSLYIIAVEFTGFLAGFYESLLVLAIWVAWGLVLLIYSIVVKKDIF